MRMGSDLRTGSVQCLKIGLFGMGSFKEFHFRLQYYFVKENFPRYHKSRNHSFNFERCFRIFFKQDAETAA
jgi:hypothetical protein